MRSAVGTLLDGPGRQGLQAAWAHQDGIYFFLFFLFFFCFLFYFFLPRPVAEHDLQVHKVEDRVRKYLQGGCKTEMGQGGKGQQPSAHTPA